MPEKTYFIGLISGTSIDGIDCALVSFTNGFPTLEATLTQKYKPDLRDKIFTLCEQNEVSLKLLGETDIAIGLCFADVVRQLLSDQNLDATQIKAIGSHGQTIFHKPQQPLPFSLQIGDPNTIAFATGITTVADFRRKDMAAGGQGAPLAPLFHRFFFNSAAHNRVIVNLGGIANISVLAPEQTYLGYDTGPANVLMDYWVNKHKQLAYDDDGNWAATGAVNADLLELLMDELYFSKPEPKSTGREYFNGDWLEGKLSHFNQTCDAADVQATLLELTATTVVTEIENQLSPDQVFICGGGAYNSTLVNRIDELLPDSQVDSTEYIGLAPDWVEAVTFAWLAQQRLGKNPVDSRSVTGASCEVVLGGVYLPG
ncbi:MAG: anhydro-N-acetylmuramic acid kinase [Gammaproteobacteria bacterium]|nr:anhydro-N-acetylmuramic acid kinase [Gammaproteobacteria bacterium]